MQGHRKSSSATVARVAGLWLAMLTFPALAQEPPGPAPLPNAAEPWPGGFYYLLDFSLGDSENPDTDADFSVDLDWSTSFGLGAGYRMGPLRLEGELNTHFYRVGSLDLGPSSPFPPADYAGGMRAYNAMANLYVDLPQAGAMRPFIGAGIGLARVEAEYNESVCFIYCFSTSNAVVDDWDAVAARQAMIGASFDAIGSNMEWYVGYRYYETDDLDFRTLSGVPFRQDGIRDHAFLAGFRFFVN